MNWAARQHPIELLVEWLAPLPLAIAGGWAGLAIGLPPLAAGVVLMLLFAAGLAVVRLADRREASGALPFEPAGYAFGRDLPELMLEAKDELLELTDPLIDIGADSRVVQLFSRPEPTPGELVDRIADYLGEADRGERVHASLPVDASDALHAALANIRASLR